MPPQNLDMSVIQEAIQRRQQGGAVPTAAQMTQPSAPNPMNGQLPTPTVSTPATPGSQQRDPRVMAPQQRQAQGGAGMTPMDDEGKAMARALATKLTQMPDLSTVKPLLQKLVQVL